MTWFQTLTTDEQRTAIAALTTSPAGREALKHAGDLPAYAAFLHAADQLAQILTGLSIHDLPDYTWRDTYDDGLTPAQALELAMAAARE